MDDKKMEKLPKPQPTLKKWDVLAKVDGSFLDKVKYFHGFQTYLADNEVRKQSAFLITTEDEVFAIGHNNEDNLLALSGDDFAKPIEVQKPKKISELSGKGIKKLTVCERFGAALTYDGKLLYWGMKMENIQFEERRKQYVTLPHEPRPNVKITNMSCGAHSITLKTAKNDIIIWGCINLYYSEFYEFKKLPVRKSVDVITISSGWYHIALLDKDGQVWTFGYGSVGQLGYKWSYQDGFTTPVKVSLPDKCVKVECGAYSTLFMLKNGDVYACGSNSKSDHLCVGQMGYVSKPLKVLFDLSIKDIAATYAWASKTWQSVFAAQATDGKTYFRWGDDSSVSTPQMTESTQSIVDAYANFKVPAALGDLQTTESILLVNKQNKNELTTNQPSATSTSSILSKWPVFDGIDKDFVEKIKYFTVVDEFADFTLGVVYAAFVLTTEGDLYGLGYGKRNTLGLTKEVPKKDNYDTPVLISKLKKKYILKIVKHLFETAALSQDGLLYTWDMNRHPMITDDLKDTPVKDVVAGSRFFLYLLDNGDVYFHGQLSYQFDYEAHKQIEIPPNETVECIVAGEWHCALLMSNAEVYTFGHGYYIQLGYKWTDMDPPYSLRKVALPDACKMVACGITSTYFLLKNGDLYACGANTSLERLHVGHSKRAITPQKVLINEKVAEICVARKYLSSAARGTVTAVKTVSSKIIRWGGNDSEPTLVHDATTLIEAFEDTTIPQPLSMVRLESLTDDDDQELEIPSENELKAGSSLLGDPLYSDVTIKLADGVIPAHKILLYKNSSFFRRAISRYEETNQEELDLSNYNPKAIRAMLKYIYRVSLRQRASSLGDVLDFHQLALEDANSKMQKESKMLLLENAFFEILSWYTKNNASNDAKMLLEAVLPTDQFP